MNIRYVFGLFVLVVQIAANGMAAHRNAHVDRNRENDQVVAIFRGTSSLLHQEPSKFSQLTRQGNESLSYRRTQEVVQSFEPFTHLRYNCRFRLMDTGRDYRCESPIISAVSQYVSDYDRFLNTVREDGLRAFGFTGELANQNLCPFQSFTTSARTARKYCTAEVSTAKIREFPYYENGRPSEVKIGSIMIAYLPVNTINDNSQFLGVDVRNETRLSLGRTTARRVGQDEICVIGGLSRNVECREIDINMPDFSQEWTYEGMNENLKGVNESGLTEREFKSWSRKVETADDRPASWRTIYENFNKRRNADAGISYLINKELAGYNLNHNRNIFQSIFVDR